jgi:hypothetical protein
VHKAQNSYVYRFLQNDYAHITHSLLIDLAKAVVENTPGWERPSPPSRNEKRVKAGILTWMDRNAPQVLHYLTSHSLPK